MTGFSFFNICYLMTLSVSRLYGVNSKTSIEYGAVGGIRIGRGNRSARRKPGQCFGQNYSVAFAVKTYH
jgi:hypothetical protein